MHRIGLGIVVLVVLLGAVAGILVAGGGMPTTAHADPPAWERSLATRALRASQMRHAPRVTNPDPTDDQSLIAGMKLYTMNCAVCHGTLDHQASPLEHNFYPPAPQLVLRPIHDYEWRTFYVVRTGVRYTGMPAWEGVLSPQDLWKVTDFISRVESLPPGAASYLRDLYAPGQ
jgi:mono/diheme cytochrome c family protein